jgi:amino acid transporter
VALENWRSGAHNRAMEQIAAKIVGILTYLAIAAMVALTVGYVAHYDFGLSRLDIRMSALIGAATIAPIVVMLMAIEHFEKNLRKPK